MHAKCRVRGAPRYADISKRLLAAVSTHSEGFLAVTAIPGVTGSDTPQAWGVLIGLLLISIGTGGIKPCVAAFGGDQFKVGGGESNASCIHQVVHSRRWPAAAAAAASLC